MKDSFAPDTSVPTSTGPLELILTVTAGSPNTYEGQYTFDVLDQDGLSIGTRRGPVIPHMTNAQKTATAALLDALLTKAQGAVA